METLSGKILTALLSFFLLIYVGYQGYRYYYTPIKTETVLGYTVQDTKRVKGLIVRDETPLQEKTEGVVAYLTDDGSKVTYGSPLAEIYADAQGITDKRRVKALEDQIIQLKSIQNPGNNYYLNSEAISKEINESLYAVIKTSETRDVLDISAEKAGLVTNLNKRQLATGAVDNFDEKIAMLETEKLQLESTVLGSSEMVKSKEVGYFSSYVDNMESTFTTDIANQITADELNEFLNNTYEQDSTILGKIIKQKAWCFMVPLSPDEAEKLKVGETLSIDFGIVSYNDVPAIITDIHRAEKGDAVVIMECNYMCPQLTRLRNPTVQLNFNVYTGLKIPSQAVRFVDNQRGVYVNTGSELRFKTLDIIYEGTGYLLSAINEDNEDQVQWFDDIVVKGTDLQDGKPAQQQN
ncbi:MAG: HlyD family efflux transporter periplasmic adaptor subunit [Hydrogenoanaerobacterium sp.]